MVLKGLGCEQTLAQFFEQGTLDSNLKICRDLAESSKHFALNRGPRVVQQAALEKGFGLGRFGVGAFGEGEGSIVIRLNDGSSHYATQFMQAVVDYWRDFLTRNGFLP
jgi:hypothetical protein